MQTILLISPYWKEEHRWMVSSVKLAQLWQRLGYRVVVACMGPKIEKEQVSESLTIYRHKDIFLPDPWNYGIAFGFTHSVRRIIKTEKPDLIVVNKILFWTSLSVIALRLTGKKVLLLTDAFVGMTWWPRGLLPKVFAAIYAWTLGWLILLSARRVVTFHPQPQQLLKRLRIAKKTEVIPTGIDIAEVSGQKLAVSGQRSEVSDPVAITYVGRLESVKGVDDFLAAAVPLKKEFPGLKIQVVGWYKENHPLVSQYEKEVIFTGLKTPPEVLEILDASDIFVLPSYSEGLSNALMEAMSAKCACIATEVGGNRFLIENSVSGFLYPPGDRPSLASHLRRLIEDPQKRTALAEAARKRIEEHFDWKVVGKQYQNLFASL